MKRDPLTKLKMALREGDENKFFDLLCKEFAPLVLAIIHNRFPSCDPAVGQDDILAIVFIKLSKKGLQPFSEASLDTISNYIYTTTLNCLRSHYRRSQRRALESPADIFPPQINSGPDHGITLFEYSDQLRELLKRLTSTQKIVFELKLSGYSHKEIAEHLGITDANSRQYLRQAILRLRKWRTEE